MREIEIVDKFMRDIYDLCLKQNSSQEKVSNITGIPVYIIRQIYSDLKRFRGRDNFSPIEIIGNNSDFYIEKLGIEQIKEHVNRMDYYRGMVFQLQNNQN